MGTTGISFILVYCFQTVAQGVLAAFWIMVKTSSILNRQQHDHHSATTVSRSDKLQPIHRRCRLQHSEHSAITAPFPFQVYFQHCERGGSITMTRSHEHQHSAPDFNSPSSRRGKVSLASFLASRLIGSVLEALVLKEYRQTSRYVRVVRGCSSALALCDRPNGRVVERS